MTIIFVITFLVIVASFAYPLWLKIILRRHRETKAKTTAINEVTLVLLVQNGSHYLNKKINFLLSELKNFKNWEFIIIDDASTDGSLEILDHWETKASVKIIRKNEKSGIPSSMNLAAEMAEYDCIVFCDQRQNFNERVLHRLTDPLSNPEIGAVSGCISEIDKHQTLSQCRSFENRIKKAESRLGSLMGVYGPLYAIRKSAYHKIPDHIILDDLYLSLCVLRTHKVIMREECQIFDGNFHELYNYGRSKRYLSGLIQLLSEKNLIKDLHPRHRIMLLWHKYLRLLIPLLLFFSYLNLILMAIQSTPFTYLLIAITLVTIISIIPDLSFIPFRLKNVIRINTCYVIASFELLIQKVQTILFEKKGSKNEIEQKNGRKPAFE